MRREWPNNHIWIDESYTREEVEKLANLLRQPGFEILSRHKIIQLPKGMIYFGTDYEHSSINDLDPTVTPLRDGTVNQ